MQGGTSYNPRSYFTDDNSGGLTKDLDKLSRLPIADSKWFLILVTRNPGEDDWQGGLTAFHEKFAPRGLAAHSQPSQFPESYFLGLLKVAGGDIASRNDSAAMPLSG